MSARTLRILFFIVLSTQVSTSALFSGCTTSKGSIPGNSLKSGLSSEDLEMFLSNDTYYGWLKKIYCDNPGKNNILVDKYDACCACEKALKREKERAGHDAESYDGLGGTVSGAGEISPGESEISELDRLTVLLDQMAPAPSNQVDYESGAGGSDDDFGGSRSGSERMESEQGVDSDFDSDESGAPVGGVYSGTGSGYDGNSIQESGDKTRKLLEWLDSIGSVKRAYAQSKEPDKVSGKTPDVVSLTMGVDSLINGLLEGISSDQLLDYLMSWSQTDFKKLKEFLAYQLPGDHADTVSERPADEHPPAASIVPGDSGVSGNNALEDDRSVRSDQREDAQSRAGSGAIDRVYGGVGVQDLNSLGSSGAVSGQAGDLGGQGSSIGQATGSGACQGGDRVSEQSDAGETGDAGRSVSVLSCLVNALRGGSGNTGNGQPDDQSDGSQDDPEEFIHTDRWVAGNTGSNSRRSSIEPGPGCQGIDEEDTDEASLQESGSGDQDRDKDIQDGPSGRVSPPVRNIDKEIASGGMGPWIESRAGSGVRQGVEVRQGSEECQKVAVDGREGTVESGSLIKPRAGCLEVGVNRVRLEPSVRGKRDSQPQIDTLTQSVKSERQGRNMLRWGTGIGAVLSASLAVYMAVQYRNEKASEAGERDSLTDLVAECSDLAESVDFKQLTKLDLLDEIVRLKESGMFTRKMQDALYMLTVYARNKENLKVLSVLFSLGALGCAGCWLATRA